MREYDDGVFSSNTFEFIPVDIEVSAPRHCKKVFYLADNSLK